MVWSCGSPLPSCFIWRRSFQPPTCSLRQRRLGPGRSRGWAVGAAGRRGYRPVCQGGRRVTSDEEFLPASKEELLMAVTVKKVTLWRSEVENKTGVLANALEPLAKAGADLQVVMGYRY